MSHGHIEKWISNFESDKQQSILKELNHVLGKTYISKHNMKSFMTLVVKDSKITGGDHESYWKNVNFLNIQGGGNSQNELLDIFNNSLKEIYSFSVEDCGKSTDLFVYIDDVLYTGNRVLIDIKKWIKESAPNNATLNIIFMILHKGGFEYANKYIESEIKTSKKQITVNWFSKKEFSDSYTNRYDSDVLHPSILPESELLAIYKNKMGHKPILRSGNGIGSSSLFSTPENRVVLETEFLTQGLYVLSICPYLRSINYMRPLGNIVLETLGFGSLIVTYRNCANNCPLVLWAGDPWYPLFPRKTN